MSTTNSGFIKATTGGNVVLFAIAAGSASQLTSLLSGTRLDAPVVSLAAAGLAKNGAVRVALSGTTPATIDLTNTTTGAQGYAGDTVFASYKILVLYNDGAASVSVAPSGSNGATLPGTMTVLAGDYLVVLRAASTTVDATHRSIDVTPTSGGSFVMLVGGA